MSAAAKWGVSELGAKFASLLMHILYSFSNECIPSNTTCWCAIASLHIKLSFQARQRAKQTKIKCSMYIVYSRGGNKCNTDDDCEWLAVVWIPLVGEWKRTNISQGDWAATMEFKKLTRLRVREKCKHETRE